MDGAAPEVAAAAGKAVKALEEQKIKYEAELADLRTQLQEKTAALGEQKAAVSPQIRQAGGAGVQRAVISYRGKDINLKVRDKMTQEGLVSLIKMQFRIPPDSDLGLVDSDGDCIPIDSSIVNGTYTLEVIKHASFGADDDDVKTPIDGTDAAAVTYAAADANEDDAATLLAKEKEERRKLPASERTNPGSIGFGTKITLTYWDVDDNEFWEREGNAITTRNLWINVLYLLMAHAVWLMWGVIVFGIKKAHKADPMAYRFMDLKMTRDDDGIPLRSEYVALVGLLPACAGLSGGVFRLVNTFMTPSCGGQFPAFFNVLQLAVVALVGSIILSNPDVGFWGIWFIVILSGVGGGGLASSCSNISKFYPNRLQGLGLGINAGLGNVGVWFGQFVCAQTMPTTVYGGTPSGGYRIANGAITMLPLCALATIMAWLWTNDLPSLKLTRNEIYTNYAKMNGIAIAVAYSSCGIFVAAQLKPLSSGPKIGVIIMAICISFFPANYLLRFRSGGKVQQVTTNQMVILVDPNTWYLTALYFMSFGSFIGFANSFPKLINDIFGYYTVDGVRMANPSAPDPLQYAPWGALIGALIRPGGGWASDKFGAALVTIIATIGQLVSAIVISITCISAYGVDDPSPMFGNFLIWFYVMFASTGINNGSVFKLAADVFDSRTRGSVLGWISACGSFGCFLLPALVAVFVKMRQPQIFFFIFAAFYVFCLGLLWFKFYLQERAVKKGTPHTHAKEPGQVTMHVKSG